MLQNFYKLNYLKNIYKYWSVVNIFLIWKKYYFGSNMCNLRRDSIEIKYRGAPHPLTQLLFKINILVRVIIWSCRVSACCIIIIINAFLYRNLLWTTNLRLVIFIMCKMYQIASSCIVSLMELITLVWITGFYKSPNLVTS